MAMSVYEVEAIPSELSKLAERIIIGARAMNLCLTGVMPFDLGVQHCDRIKQYLRAARDGARDARVGASRVCSSETCFVKVYRTHEETFRAASATIDDADALFAAAITQGSPLEAAIEGIYVMSKSLRGEVVPGGRIGVIIRGGPATMENRCGCWFNLQHPKPVAPR